MSVRPIQFDPANAARATSRRAVGRERPALAVLEELGRRLDPRDPAVVRRTSAQMVAEMVFVPLLAQMRTFPFGQEIGRGGRGEAVFAEQLDRRVAEAAAAADHGGLVDQLARRLTAADRGEPATQGGQWSRWCSWPAHQQAHRTPEAGNDDA